MFIELKIKYESEKAYQLENDSWLPKSVLDSRGLKHPYYQIKMWWLNIQIENVRFSLCELNNMGRKIKTTENDVKNSKFVLWGLKPLVITMKDIPVDIREYWRKYWHDASSNLGVSTPDFEPRIWGNDCFDGEMSTWFD